MSSFYLYSLKYSYNIYIFFFFVKESRIIRRLFILNVIKFLIKLFFLKSNNTVRSKKPKLIKATEKDKLLYMQVF